MSSQSTIACVTLEDFGEVCVELVKQGVIFQANTMAWTITLTGGY
jgi:hypothetical protein